VLLILWGAVFLDVYSLQGLFADGANYTHGMLVSGKSPRFIWGRAWGDQILFLPAWLGLRLGVSDVGLMLRLVSFGLAFFPVLFWSWALLRVWNTYYFWPTVSLCAVVFFNTGFFAIGEYNLAYAMVALVVTVLLTLRRSEPVDWVILLATTVLLMRVYEAMVFLAPMLSLVAFQRFRGLPKRTRMEAGLVVVFQVVCFGAFICAWYAIRHFPFPRNLKHAQDISVLLANRQMLVSLALFSLMLIQGLGAMGRLGAWAGAIGLGGVALFLIPDLQASSHDFYKARILGGLALCLGLGAVALLRGQAPAPGRWTWTRWAGPFVLLLVLSGLDVRHNLGWRQFVWALQGVVTSQRGIVPYDQTVLTGPKYRRYAMEWTTPTMSHLLRTTGEGALVLDPDYAHQIYRPFDPYKKLPEFVPQFRM